MLPFVLRRIAVSVPVLILSSLIVYILVAKAGDPLADLESKQPKPSPAVFAQRRHQLGLDQNVFHRWINWLGNFVTGDFGHSSQFPALSVRSDLFHRLAVTGRMVILATLLAVLLAILSGVLSAVKQYTSVDYVFTFLSFLFLSVPVFFFAGLLKDQAIRQNERSGSTFFDTIGDGTPNLTGPFFFTRLSDDIGHLILPTIALTLITYPSWSRFQRASMLEVLNSDYVRLARAKGLSRSRVMVRHALRTALIPLSTVVAIDVGAVFGGVVLTEAVFAWHGMGEMLVTAVQNQDLNRTLAWLMTSAFFVILFNLLADMLYAVLDPRIRL